MGWDGMMAEGNGERKYQLKYMLISNKINEIKEFIKLIW